MIHYIVIFFLFAVILYLMIPRKTAAPSPNVKFAELRRERFVKGDEIIERLAPAYLE